jgi:hypothetical protein
LHIAWAGNEEQPVELLFKIFQRRVGSIFVSCIGKTEGTP